MAEYRRQEIISGLFILAAVLVFTVFAFRVGGLDLFALLRSRAIVCHAYFNDARTLDTGAKVTTAGRRVGQVSAIRIVDRELDAAQVAELLAASGKGEFAGLAPGMKRQVVQVEFELDDAELRLDPQTARVQIAQEGLLGRHFLSLDPGYWSEQARPAPIFEAGLHQPLEVRVRDTGGLDQLMSSLRPVIEKVDGLLSKLQHGLLSGPNIERASALLEGVDAAVRDVRAILDRDDASGVYRRIVDPLSRLLTDADATVQKAGGLVTDASGMLAETRPQIAGILGDLTETSRNLDRRIGELQVNLQRLTGSAADMVTENRAELAETLRRMRRTMWQAEMAMRKIRANPAYLLFGDDETDLEAAGSDVAPFTRSGRARPYRQRDETDEGK